MATKKRWILGYVARAYNFISTASKSVSDYLYSYFCHVNNHIDIEYIIPNRQQNVIRDARIVKFAIKNQTDKGGTQ